MPRPAVPFAVLAAASAATLLALPLTSARAQGESLAQKAAKIQSDQLFDLNGDGKVDDYERDLVMQNLRAQNAINPNTGEIDREKLKKLQADRKRLQAEARRRERMEEDAAKLREKQANGHRLTAGEEARLHAADEAAEARRRERENEAREAAKAPRSQAAQRLAEPIINY